MIAINLQHVGTLTIDSHFRAYCNALDLEANRDSSWVGVSVRICVAAKIKNPNLLAIILTESHTSVVMY